jgi:hypothetical protein
MVDSSFSDATGTSAVTLTVASRKLPLRLTASASLPTETHTHTRLWSSHERHVHTFSMKDEDINNDDGL